MSRIENVGKNSAWQTASLLLSTLLGFIGRILFMHILGERYLGISGLFSSVIGVLSFADLGLASAFTFCFYRPIAQSDMEHIRALLTAFKRVILFIALFISAAGLAIIPFLRFFVKGADNISDAQLTFYYLITLASTVISYWLMYKTCYITARQEAYRLTPFTMAGNLITVLLQIAALVVSRNYAVWAMAALAVSVGQRIIMDAYIRKWYPETNADASMPLPESDKKSIISNVKGILMHKLGDICVNQTDNIIVSAMISISTTGLLSNYTLIRTTVLSVVSTIQNSLVASMGNLMVSESKEIQLNVFYTYMMVNYWMLGFAMCGVGVLSTPFIALVFGATKVVDDWTVLYSCMGFYFAYQTYALNLLPTAGGKFILGAWAAIVEGLSNLVISLVAAEYMGLPGVFVGTVLSQVINYLIRPFPIFRGMYGMKPYKYFRYTLSLFASAMVPYGALLWLRGVLFANGTSWLGFILLAFLVVAGFGASVWLFWHRNHYYREAVGTAKTYLTALLQKRRAAQ